MERSARPNRLVTLAAASALLAAGCGSPPAGTDGWSHYGTSLGGDRYAAPSAITPENVEQLSLAWVYRTGDANDGIFTPPSLDGTLLYPGNAGGTNWGSMAYDRGARIGYVAVSRLPTIVKLIPREQFRAAARQGTLNGARAQHTEQEGTPYGMARPVRQPPADS